MSKVKVITSRRQFDASLPITPTKKNRRNTKIGRKVVRTDAFLSTNQQRKSSEDTEDNKLKYDK